MLIDSIRVQFRDIIRRRNYILIYFFMLLLVFVNFMYNMIQAEKIQYVTQMYDFTKQLTLSMWSKTGYFFMDYLPLIVVIPTAFTYLNDKKSGMLLLMKNRMSNRSYLYGKVVASFVSTFLLFVIPFVLEVFLSMLCFDKDSLGDPSNFQYYQTIESDSKFFMSKLFLDNRIVYAIVLIILFGIVAGILAAWNVAVTMILNLKYKVFAFFPVYLLVYFINFVEKTVRPSFTLNYFQILTMFNISSKNYSVYSLFMLGLIILTIFAVEFRCKKEMIV